ncbi:hypothetical protein niasHT_007025 [Heterodera trifolii]|uniref:Uncharacterized protein n=1 Tax=Heterodera trifolii TaxID=157864 RepID=A0ABD2LXC4_9BILA
MNANLHYPRERFVAVVGHDPFHCLRCFSIAVAIWNILYCLLQFALLGWQVQVVKQWQWHWENRALPVTGAIDQYQARFPGLYAIYTETPERRRVNAMYAIVLICLGLTFVHLFLSAAMLYGCVKRLPQWLFPWFFSALPLIVLSTAYSVLWWSGDVFNEQLTFSVAQFAMSLAVNGVCFVVVLLYYLRLRGKLTSERTGGEFSPGTIQQKRQPNLPPWGESFSEKVPANIAQKLRRKERRERQLREKVQKKSTRGEEREWKRGKVP